LLQGVEHLKLSDESVTLDDLFEPICESRDLQNTPKMFFIQACRTENYMENDLQIDLGALKRRDNLYMYACPRGYKAWRNAEHSYFISELANTITRYGKRYDMDAMAKAVRRDMEYKYPDLPTIEYQEFLMKKVRFHEPSLDI